jgi:hypothetical protein
MMHITHQYTDRGDLLLSVTVDNNEVDSTYAQGAGGEGFWDSLAKLGLGFTDRGRMGYGRNFVIVLTARHLFERQLGSPEAAKNWLLSQVQTMLTS